MGIRLFDGYTLLHFATGVLAHHWSFSFWGWILLHTMFEIVENTRMGMNIINNYITLWPGGKPSPDTFRNTIGDTIAAAIGWIASYWLLTYSPE